MIINLANAQPNRVLVLPNWRRIWLQVLVGSLRLGTQSSELTTSLGVYDDGIWFDAANANPFIDWWNGELWMIARVPQCTAILVVPGKGKGGSITP